MSKYQLTSEERAERLKTVHDRLSQAVEQLVTGEDWESYLASMAKFHAYSHQNCLLIAMQRPDATRVAGYKTWQSLGRQVVKGSKGIAILAPSTRKIEDKATGDEAIQLVGFRTTNVFALETTDGEPLPEVSRHLPGDAPYAMSADLAARIEASAFTVHFEPEIPGLPSASGECDFGNKVVTIAVKGRDLAHQAKTLAHELAHIRCTHDKQGLKSRALKEVEAESVAYLIADAYGLDTSGYTLGYVATWSKGDPKAILATAKTVQTISRAILEEIEQVKEQLAA